MDINDLNRELSGKPPRSEFTGKKPRAKKTNHPAKPPAPVAAHWASEIAEDFLARALDQDMEPPYNANFLANEISTRTWREPKFRALQEAGRETDVHRWVAEMVVAFWKTDREDGFSYVRAGDTAGKIKDVFLVEVWDDLRDTAYDTLRARYLKTHGRAKAMPDYIRQDSTDLHQDLRRIALESYLERDRASREEIRELHHLDESARAVLSSAVEKRRNS